MTQVSEAKDFLVKQTVIQASLDGVPLSDVEKRMMYFTEGPDATEKSAQLNEAFEAAYETAPYEVKVSKLLHRAYARGRKGNPETAQTWNECLCILKNGDHYLSVLWDEKGSTKGSINNFPTTLILVITSLVALVGLPLILDHYGVQSGSRRAGPNSSSSSLPPWIQKLFVFLMIVSYGNYVVVPWMTKRPFRKKKSN